MQKIVNRTENHSEIIKIPGKYVEKIDRLIKCGISNYTSREEFITSAVQIKLAGLKSSGTK